LTSKLLNALKQKISGYRLIPTGGGAFELSVNGELLYSKLKTGEFPDEEKMLAEVSKLAKSR
jgi:selenoprotein W-related protein